MDLLRISVLLGLLVSLSGMLGCGSSSESVVDTSSIAVVPAQPAAAESSEADESDTSSAEHASEYSSNTETGDDSSESENTEGSDNPTDDSDEMIDSNTATEPSNSQNNATAFSFDAKPSNTSPVKPNRPKRNEAYAGLLGDLQSIPEEFDFGVTEVMSQEVAELSNPIQAVQQAFANGEEDRALEMLFDLIIVDPEAAEQAGVFEAARLCTITRRPRWLLKIGIGLNTAAVKHSGEMHPIRSNMQSPVERSSGGLGNAQRGTNPVSGLGGSNPQDIDKYSGLVGEIAGDMFAARFSQGDFGPLFKSVGGAISAPASEAPRAGQRAPRQTAQQYNAAAADATMNRDDFEDMTEGAMDPSAMSAGPGQNANSSGTNMSGDPAGMAGSNYSASRSAAASFASVGNNRLRPGLRYIGSGRPNELMERAREEQLDAFLQIDVAVSSNARTGRVDNDSSVKWYLPSTGKAIRTSEKLNNVKVFQAMESRGVDPGETVRSSLSAMFNDTLPIRLRAMPPLTPEQAKVRISRLIAQPREQVKAALVEVQLYRSLGLLTDEEVLLAYDLFLGDEGLVLCAGSPQERQSKLESIDLTGESL